MKKAKAVLLGTLIIFIVVAVVWFLSTQEMTMTAIIINIILVMVGLMITITVVNRQLHKQEKLAVHREHYPKIEDDLIQVKVASFCDKLKKYKGTIYLIDDAFTERGVTLVKWKYDKLLDQLMLQFTGGLKTVVVAPWFIAVGDYQFMLNKFDTLVHSKGNKKLALRWNRSQLLQLKDGEEVPVKIHHKTPIFIFDWQDYPEQNKGGL